MGNKESSIPQSPQRIEWQWQSNPNPWSKTEPSQWTRYGDVHNMIIEDALKSKQPIATLDGHYIDFKRNVQILFKDSSKQRPVRRLVCGKDDRYVREERFSFDPISPKRPFGGEYGWVSPFIIEVRRELGLRKDQLPSKDPTIIPMLVDKAAQGIVEEGQLLNKTEEAKKIAELLLAKKNAGVNEVWCCCAHLYTLESFLFKKINEVMRLIGDDKHEKMWRSKLRTLGPFCLLLWDDPFNQRVRTKITLYRGTTLTEEQIATYRHMADNPNEYRSFQAFTSSSRDRMGAESFGNVLFIMNVLFAFIADVSSLSEFKEEEEELIMPGVCFSVEKVHFDQNKKKHLIYLTLRQRFSSEHIIDFLAHKILRLAAYTHKKIR